VRSPPGLGQEFADQRAEVDAFLAGGDDLDAIAGRQDQRFGDSLPRFQLGDRFGQRGFWERNPLPYLDRRCLVADACDEQLHWVR